MYATSNSRCRGLHRYQFHGTKITDIGLSYSVRGELSDVYESTPHSGGYYHASATYWANGALDVLTAKYGTSSITGLPTFTYAPDGEGRIATVSASAGQNPVTGTTYSVASLPTLVTLGSSDNDSFTYDPNTNRMTQYEFTVNAQSVVGKLTWNSIGTLEDLSVTDPFFSGGNQSCAYTHDDLSRIASANCGSSVDDPLVDNSSGNFYFGFLGGDFTVTNDQDAIFGLTIDELAAIYNDTNDDLPLAGQSLGVLSNTDTNIGALGLMMFSADTAVVLAPLAPEAAQAAYTGYANAQTELILWQSAGELGSYQSAEDLILGAASPLPGPATAGGVLGNMLGCLFACTPNQFH